LLKERPVELNRFEIDQANLGLTNERVVRVVEQTREFTSADELEGCIKLVGRCQEYMIKRVMDPIDE
jgi:hypothetical protein